jgi:hypothetical protein
MEMNYSEKYKEWYSEPPSYLEIIESLDSDNNVPEQVLVDLFNGSINWEKSGDDWLDDRMPYVTLINSAVVNQNQISQYSLKSIVESLMEEVKFDADDYEPDSGTGLASIDLMVDGNIQMLLDLPQINTESVSFIADAAIALERAFIQNPSPDLEGESTDELPVFEYILGHELCSESIKAEISKVRSEKS